MRVAASKGVRRAKPPVPQQLLLRVTLRNIEPPIWRELIVPDHLTLLQIHRTIQLVFDWLDYHLFEFRIGKRRFEEADPEAKGENADLVRLRDLHLRRGSRFLYIYDMGDYWEHDIDVRQITTHAPNSPPWAARLVGGARAAPPEDVGGPGGYERLVGALAVKADGEYEDLVEWAGADFDPELFDRRAVDHALSLTTAWRVI